MPAFRSSSAPRIVAHRGASALAPENTIEAFARAVQMRADGIELDLQRSRDGEIFVYHDVTLRKVGGRGRLVDTDAEALRRLDASPPTLDAVLDRFGGRVELMLELKSEDRALARAVKRAVTRRDLADHVWILSFFPEALRWSVPLRRVLNVSERPRWGAALRSVLGSAAVLCCPARHMTRTLATRLHDAGKQAWVYRCDTPRNADAALRAGVDAVITDRPDWMRTRVDRRARTRERSRTRAGASHR